ncbi:MAG: TRAP transporter large permease subunit [Deltaproteobacteria bacterium]|nr:TRAP transporter large permease subunit [Deltaproteobacteria bacterium]
MTAVFWATVIAVALSFVRRECALTPGRLLRALEAGSVGVLGVAVTCAAAGLIVGVVTLTGLGLKFSSIIIEYAGRSVFLTALYSGLIVWLVGLAVPVTASYIICAVIVAPALTRLGVTEAAAHMFIFYYAVLSEVSPPTALSPFAAAAITGGNPYRTTLHSWKYTLPAFVVPFMFVLDPAGAGILLTGPWTGIVWTSLTACVGIAALAGGVQGWLLERTSPLERLFLVTAGLLLVYPRPLFDCLGIALVALTAGMQAGLLPRFGATAAPARREADR